MTTANDLKQALLGTLVMALSEPVVNDVEVNEIMDRLDQMSGALSD